MKEVSEANTIVEDTHDLVRHEEDIGAKRILIKETGEEYLIKNEVDPKTISSTLGSSSVHLREDEDDDEREDDGLSTWRNLVGGFVIALLVTHYFTKDFSERFDEKLIGELYTSYSIRALESLDQEYQEGSIPDLDMLKRREEILSYHSDAYTTSKQSLFLSFIRTWNGVFRKITSAMESRALDKHLDFMQARQSEINQV
eukprot:CAMPEP_0117428950 /NCGR_PEP_ID=MMETSP0758-20121206/8549_1 /TAXON_ID=63605 /ORGANISM="Percolomonas cosmopolitus, Strain AE-1 (ATCC 50343)" /LENGTH=199 /DNA_ID=CAMNT_0005215601 /DNA_START=131 /DNA_END=726 /DNA_ORIENTATION=+